MSEIIERWKLVPGWPYEVSTFGNVRSKTRVVRGDKWHIGKVLTPAITNSGYLFVVFSVKGESRSFLVHQLVAEAFLPVRPVGSLPDHRDGDRRNNRMTNLQWLTHSENVKKGFEQSWKRIAAKAAEKIPSEERILL